MKDHGMNCDFNCPEPDCPEWFVSSVVLTAHRLESHNYDPIKDRKPEKQTEVTPYKCHICGKYYKSQCTLDGHIMGIHKKSEHNVKCDQCDFKTFRKSILRMHVRYAHTKEWKQKGKKNSSVLNVTWCFFLTKETMK